TVDLPAGTTIAVLRDRIELERRLELNMEGHRWFDLLRTERAGQNRALQVMNAYFTQYSIRPNNSAAGSIVQIDQHNLLFPLPIQEIQTNPILTQNPGYN
ncbi:RagB/SusD family nutrient uptake outer membrane protein, partial [Hymenobacter agri]